MGGGAREEFGWGVVMAISMCLWAFAGGGGWSMFLPFLQATRALQLRLGGPQHPNGSLIRHIPVRSRYSGRACVMAGVNVRRTRFLPGFYDGNAFPGTKMAVTMTLSRVRTYATTTVSEKTENGKIITRRTHVC